MQTEMNSIWNSKSFCFKEFQMKLAQNINESISTFPPPSPNVLKEWSNCQIAEWEGKKTSSKETNQPINGFFPTNILQASVFCWCSIPHKTVAQRQLHENTTKNEIAMHSRKALEVFANIKTYISHISHGVALWAECFWNCIRNVWANTRHTS